jgi:acetyl esterase/lipase
VVKPYPAALEDCCAALLWLRENGGRYGMRPDQVFIGGSSAGGGLTAALSLYARDAGIPVAFQMPLYPMLDDRPTPSNTGNTAPLWNSKSNARGWRLYLGGLYGQPQVPAYAAPARAETWAGLPPTCTFVGDIEPFFDETTAYADNLRRNGIPVHFKIFPGCFHAFDLVCPNTQVAKEAADFLEEAFRYAVGHYFAPGNSL